MRYRAEIDGLRAVAVVPVIFFHAGFSLFNGGYVGVDVFFVISGYLITSIIMDDLDKGKFSLVRFYERRARRILPALVFVMLASLPFAWGLMIPPQLKAFAKSIIATNLFSSNILFWQESNYFGATAEEKPLLHTWSLAVEEQYYLFFPLLLIVLWRFGFKPMLYILLTIALASLALSEWGARDFPTANFFLAPTRVWELLFGSICAFIAFKTELKPNQWLSLTGLVLIVVAIFLYDESTPFPSLYAVAPVLGTSLIILYGLKGTIVGNFLAQRVLVGLGLISYSAYLWHQPIFAFARIGYGEFLNDQVMLLLSAISLVLAYFSWRFVELPFRHTKHSLSISRAFVFKSAAGFTTLLVVAGYLGYATDGFKENYLNNRLSVEEAKIIRLVDKSTQVNLYDYMVDDGNCKFSDLVVTKEAVSRFEKCAEKYEKAVIVLGDSHGMNLYNVVAKSDVYPFVFGVVQGGCRPHRNKKKCQYDGFDKFLKQNSDKVKTVLFHQSGSYFIKDGEGNVDTEKVFDAGTRYGFDDRNIDLVIDYLKRISKFADVVWLGPFVEARIDFNDYEGLLKNLKLNEKSIRIFDDLEKFIAGKIKPSVEQGAFRYLSLVDELALKQDFLKVGDCITYLNGDHFSLCGEGIIAGMIYPSLKSTFR